MLLAKGAWVVVADGEKALILENTGDLRQPQLRLIEREEADTEMPGADTAPPGRVFESMAGGRRSAMDQPDYGRLVGERFAADLVEMLTRRARAGEFDKLVLVAPPQVLGALRDEMDDALRAVVVAELPKTLTKHPVAKIAEVVAAELDAL
ncbi:hypothetical protein CCR83_06595 [Rhodobacter veldkampii DSM 11550]|uniref:Host attachment protein n=1 Tax=Phaeovulum veldkampii DSM 11550 TaxID=1185920 RepID=A0A2T4JGB0_9RHOB|nr:host attachment family protein [Phaeovulum veldkampii]MBK5946126.1 hypothetical protein [Phaeovulum veldkampii DSM 11550]PTE16950.1 Host attachment protein [Phaeovulum veldkampii DSM 11550]TDQ56448.1 protein required for attachment to host cells [Phaeovulum veldkampii DSM 11550]